MQPPDDAPLEARPATPLDAPHDDDLLWLLSYYRSAEIAGSLFFGRLARTLAPGDIQVAMTHHFADEARHAALLTSCITSLGWRPVKVRGVYQEAYAQRLGVPVNLMEVLAITHVFEKRVVHQYARQRVMRGMPAIVVDTLETILEDERGHIGWVGDALAEMAPEMGADVVDATLKRYREADRQLYADTMAAHDERVERFLERARQAA